MSTLRWLELLDALVPSADTPDTQHARVYDSHQQLLWNELEGMVHKLATSPGMRAMKLRDEETREVVQAVLSTILSPEEAARLRHLKSAEGRVKLLTHQTARALVNAKERLSRTLRVPPARMPPVGASDPRIDEARLEWLRAEVKRLSQNDRVLLELRFQTGLPIAEIARQRGSSYSAIAVRLFLLVKRLRAGLEPAL